MAMIIGVAGQLASGKDTIADHVAKVLNEVTEVDFKRSAFALAVKQVFMDTFDKDMDFVEEWKRISEPPDGFSKNVRQALQFIGDGFRQIKPDIWLQIAMRGDHARVISDARYFNEANAIKQHGGLNFLVWRPGYENNDPNPSESQIKPVVDWCAKHLKNGPIPDDLEDLIPEGHEVPVEMGQVKLYDYFIINEGDIDYLLSDIVEKQLVPFIREKYGI